MSDAEPANVERDRHLFGPGKKRILSIDGGGVRGVLALGYLERLERHLAELAGRPVKLCEHFDLIGGTSTGAIIATALALGHTAKEIREFYLRLGPSVFRRPFFRLPGWQAKFDAEALRRQLVGIVGDRKLDTPDLRTGLGIMLKRIDNGSSWILTNNPRSPFWAHPPDGSYIGNRDYSLAQIVRASTAAPHYFDPQEIEIVKGGPAALFVDGGLTPHNDPSLALYLVAVLPGYRLEWAPGADKLTIVSIGTGFTKVHLTETDLRRASAVTIALRALMQQISDNQKLTLTLMSWLGAGGAPLADQSRDRRFARRTSALRPVVSVFALRRQARGGVVERGTRRLLDGEGTRADPQVRRPRRHGDPRRSRTPRRGEADDHRGPRRCVRTPGA